MRNFTKEDLRWVNNAICLRDAGVSVETIVEYVKLFRQWNVTIEEGLSLLKETRHYVLEAKKNMMMH